MPKLQRNYPKFISPSGQIYTCIAYAISLASGWEWYAFEATPIPNNSIEYFGYVMGIENEFGYFYSAELIKNNISICTDPAELAEISPPIGWFKK